MLESRFAPSVVKCWPRETADFGGRFARAVGDGQIGLHQPPVRHGQQPADESEQLSEPETAISGSGSTSAVNVRNRR